MIERLRARGAVDQSRDKADAALLDVEHIGECGEAAGALAVEPSHRVAADHEWPVMPAGRAQHAF